MKPWEYISQVTGHTIPHSIMYRLDSFEQDVEVLNQQIWVQYDEADWISRIDAYLLTKSHLIVGLTVKEENQRVFTLVAYPLQHVALVDRRFVYDETQGAARGKFKGDL